jgi:hypothetical protein
MGCFLLKNVILREIQNQYTFRVLLAMILKCRFRGNNSLKKKIQR